PDPANAFQGSLDEVRIWEKVRLPEDIQRDMYRHLKGDEQSLVSYWTFDDLPNRTPDGIVGDYSKDGGHHGIISGAKYSSAAGLEQGKIFTNNNGSYKIENIYYGEETEFTLTPSIRRAAYAIPRGHDQRSLVLCQRSIMLGRLMAANRLARARVQCKIMCPEGSFPTSSLTALPICSHTSAASRSSSANARAARMAA
ncbi:MAG: hypothetical protein O6829_07125, partial [Alphaproteobacteria bacterium]|nr:hypothetical protein [Alphaproteobacteria bacterium]